MSVCACACLSATGSTLIGVRTSRCIYVASRIKSYLCATAQAGERARQRERDRERERQHDKRVEAEEGNVPKDKLAKRETGEYTAMQAVEKQKVK